MNETTKVCPHCGGDCPVSLPSLNTKLCSHCRKLYNWPLEPGQKPLHGPARAVLTATNESEK